MRGSGNGLGQELWVPLRVGARGCLSTHLELGQLDGGEGGVEIA